MISSIRNDFWNKQRTDINLILSLSVVCHVLCKTGQEILKFLVTTKQTELRKMDSLCGGTIDCLSCLKDSRYFVQLRNLTTCCIYNLGNFDLQYFTALHPGDESMCPVEPSNVLAGALGSVAGVGILVGVGFGIGCWIRSRRLGRRLDLAERRASCRDAQVSLRRGGEQTRLLDSMTDRDTGYNGSGSGSGTGPGSGLNAVTGSGMSTGSGSGSGLRVSGSQLSTVISAPQQQQQQQKQQQQQQLALIPTRSRRSYATTDYGMTEAERLEEQEQLLKLSRWLTAGASVSKTTTKETGGTKVIEKYEMTAL